MVDSDRVALALAFVIGAASVTLLFQALSFVGLVFIVAGGGLSLLSVRHSEDLSSPPSAAQLGLGLGFLFGLPVYYILVVLVSTISLFLTSGPAP